MTSKGIITAGLVVAALAATPALAHQAPKAGAGMAARQAAPTATAELVDAQGHKVGTAQLSEVQGGVRIVLEASNLPPGVHGFHVHGTGKCEGPDFKSAGGHFNPDGKQHGFHNPEGPHAGDLPNLVVDEHGTAKADFVAPMLTLSPGKYSLLDADGSALMIHASADDYVSNPAGNAGPRLACGPIVAAGLPMGDHSQHH